MGTSKAKTKKKAWEGFLGPRTHVKSSWAHLGGEGMAVSGQVRKYHKGSSQRLIIIPASPQVSAEAPPLTKPPVTSHMLSAHLQGTTGRLACGSLIL